MYLRQVGFIYLLEKTKYEYKNLNKAALRYIYQNESDKECFQCDIYCVKTVRTRSVSGPFVLNTDIYPVNLPNARK